MRKLIDLTGKRFGRWIVLERKKSDKCRNPRWLCRCECGKEKIVRGTELIKGLSKGCKSCHIRRKNTIHGQSGNPLYHVWQSMIHRCENSNMADYKYYGDRGIKICKEWHDIAIFLKWALSHGYKEGLSIDRINNDGNYNPANCRFITKAAQHRNTRRNRLITINDEKKTIAEWAELSGINYQTLIRRLNIAWPEERLLEPVHN